MKSPMNIFFKTADLVYGITQRYADKGRFGKIMDVLKDSSVRQQLKDIAAEVKSYTSGISARSDGNSFSEGNEQPLALDKSKEVKANYEVIQETRESLDTQIDEEYQNHRECYALIRRCQYGQ